MSVLPSWRCKNLKRSSVLSRVFLSASILAFASSICSRLIDATSRNMAISCVERSNDNCSDSFFSMAESSAAPRPFTSAQNSLAFCSMLWNR